MKKTLSFSFLLFSALMHAQMSMVVNQQLNPTALAPNATVDLATTPFNPKTVIMHVTNTSTNTNSYHVKRYDVTLHSTASATAEANFYFGGNDYGSPAQISLIALTLSPNQSSATMGDYFSLGATLTEANTNGYSLVKYTIINANQASDSVQFSLRYNQPTPLNIGANHLLTKPLQVAPSPVRDQANLTVYAETSAEYRLSLFNSIGQRYMINRFLL